MMDNKSLKKIWIFLLISILAANAFAADKTTTTAKNQQQDTADQITTMMASLPPEKRAAVEKKLKKEQLIETSPYRIEFYKPTYILPFYYTGSPYNKIYEGNTPDNQTLKSQEFKAQFSFKLSLFHDLFGPASSLNLAYTQLMYWQFYVNSQYFRETDYEPEIFISKMLTPHLRTNLGIEHQSNGRGGDLERSWNRTYINMIFSNNNWMVSLKPWLLIFKNESSKLHNSDITHYMGHGETTFAYNLDNNTFSLMFRNQITSGFRHGGLEADWSFPIYKVIKGYVQFFSGYGQSLIEYDHRTNSVGIGLTLSDWI